MDGYIKGAERVNGKFNTGASDYNSLLFFSKTAFRCPSDTKPYMTTSSNGGGLSFGMNGFLGNCAGADPRLQAWVKGSQVRYPSLMAVLVETSYYPTTNTWGNGKDPLAVLPNHPGVMENSGAEKYNGRFNLDANVLSWLTIGMQLNGYIQDLGTHEQEYVPDFNLSF